ncbi:MAG: AIM24 family protein [Sutterella sp.]
MLGWVFRLSRKFANLFFYESQPEILHTRFFIMQATGHGILAVSGFGSLAEVEVTRDKPVLVDNGHLVAWDADLKYEVAISTAHKGFFGTMVESVTSGEGVVLKFSGTGKVIVGSRNRTEFLNWIIGKMPAPSK